MKCQCNKKKTGRVALWLAILLCVSIFCGLLQGIGSASVTLTVHFDEASKGMNPDGSPFNISEIFSDNVLSGAAETLGLEDPAALREHLSIADTMQAETYGKVKQSILNGEPGSYYPTTYRLTYRAVSEDIRSRGIGAVLSAVWQQLRMPPKKEVLTAVADSYAKWFAKNHLVKESVFLLDWERLDKLDYYDRAEQVEAAALCMSRFLQERYDENVDVMDYGELYYAVQHVVMTDMENYTAYVVQNGLTENRDALLRRFRYLEQRSLEQEERNTATHEILTDAVELYDPDVTKVVFIPALDQWSSFYMNRTKVGVDYLVEDADTAKLDADAARSRARQYAYLLEQFAPAGEPDEEVFAQADVLYETLKTKLSDLAEQTAALIAAEAENDYEKLDIGTPTVDLYPVAWAVKSAKIFIPLVLAAFLLQYAVGALKKQTKRKEDKANVGS